MTDLATANRWPETFPADWREIYVEGGASLSATADALSVRYGRPLGEPTVRAWAVEAGLTIRVSTQFASRRARIAGLREVRRAEARGELVPAPATEEGPLDIPFERPGFAFADIPHGGCSWPISADEASAADFRFCGEKRLLGRSYCPAHVRMAYRPDGR